MPARLSSAAITDIHSKVDDLFDRLKTRFLGPKASSKKLYIGYKRDTSLPGVYESALADEGGLPDRARLNQMIETASNYLEAQRHKAKANVVQAVQSHLDDVNSGIIDSDVIQAKLGGALAEIFGTAKHEVRRILDAETQKARSIGHLAGIDRVSSSLGIKDPAVFFVVKKDKELCDECRKLHLLDDGITPRVWKRSELGSGYHERGDPNPKITGLHPNCRCSITMILPGFGFTSSGNITWIGADHDEYASQRVLDT
jgi:hypothetical protein